MPERLYPGLEAARDLETAGLLAGVLVEHDGSLCTIEPGEAPLKSSGFAGAGLDSRALGDSEIFIALPGQNVDGRRFVPDVLVRGHWTLTDPGAGDLEGAAAAPGAGVLLSDDPVAALRELAARWRGRLDPVVVGVTGTNGKTTTKDLTAALLGAAGSVLFTQGNLNNHLGVPVTLLGLQPRHRCAVIEMGASAQGEIGPLAAAAAPRVGVITNASPAHLAEFGSLAGIIAGKGELLDELPADGTAILNADSPGFEQWSKRAGCRVVSFGLKAGDHRWTPLPAAPDAGPLEAARIELDGRIWPVPLPGAHNGANLTAAILAARAAGLADEVIRVGLANFRGSAHRGIRLRIGGRNVLDDCYNANPGSVLAAASALADLPGDGRAIAVLGHMAELGDESDELHRQTGRRLAEGPAEVLLAVGEAAAPLVEGFIAGGKEAHACADCDDAADWLADRSHAGDRILVKGSRSARLERLLDALQVRFGKENGD